MIAVTFLGMDGDQLLVLFVGFVVLLVFLTGRQLFAGRNQ